MTRIVIVLAALIVSMTQAHADFGAGFAAYSRGDYETAVAEWRTLADAGDIKAQVGLGFMHEKGLGVPQDFTKAVRWYRFAADQDDAIAQYNLGVMYGNGTGVLQDYVEAHRLFSLSATRGNEDAKNSLSYIEKLMTPAQLALSKTNNVDVAVIPAGTPAPDLAPIPDPAPINDAADAAQAADAAIAAIAADTAPIAENTGERPATPLVNPDKAPQETTAKVSPPIAQVAKAVPTEAAPLPVAKVTPAATTPIITPAQQVAPTPPVQVAATTPAPVAKAAPASGPWQVHLVSLQNGAAVDGEWQRLRKLHPGALNALSLDIQEIDIPDKGHFYRLMAGSFNSKTSAETACAVLEAQDQYCRPVRR